MGTERESLHLRIRLNFDTTHLFDKKNKYKWVCRLLILQETKIFMKPKVKMICHRGAEWQKLAGQQWVSNVPESLHGLDWMSTLHPC